MSTYRSFLLRVWRTADTGELRASLTDVDSESTVAFSDLDALRDWLERAVLDERTLSTWESDGVG